MMGFGIVVELWVVVDNTGLLVSPMISCFGEGNELPWWQIGRTTWYTMVTKLNGPFVAKILRKEGWEDDEC